MHDKNTDKTEKRKEGKKVDRKKRMDLVGGAGKIFQIMGPDS